MSRLVDPVPRAGQLFAGEDRGDKTKEWSERVAKYVPAEVIAAYLTLLPIVLAGSDPDTTRRTVLLGVIVAIGFIFTPLYFSRLNGNSKSKRFHQFLSTAAFLLWSYSIPEGFFDDVGLYDHVVAPILLVIFSLASGFFAPTEA